MRSWFARWGLRRLRGVGLPSVRVHLKPARPHGTDSEGSASGSSASGSSAPGSSEGPEPSTRSKSASSRNWKLTSSVGSSLAPRPPTAVGPVPSVAFAFLRPIESGRRLVEAGTRVDGRGRGAIVTGGSTLERTAGGIVVALTVRDSDAVLMGGKVRGAAVTGMALDSGTSSHPASRLRPEASSALSHELPFAR